MKNADQKFMILDFETKSRANLKKTGAYDYAADPSTEVLCTGYRIGTRKEIVDIETRVIENVDWLFLEALADPDIHLVAHNVFFEYVIVQLVIGRKFPHIREATRDLKRWTCTAAMSRRMGLPGKLEHAAAALGLHTQKDMHGHQVMLKLSAYGEPEVGDMETLLQYCDTDVHVEAELFQLLPMLDAYERDVWENDIRMNLRGFMVDRTLVVKALEGIDRVKTWADKEIQRLTKGSLKSARQRDAFLEYLVNRNYFLSDLTRYSVQAAFNDPDTPEDVKRLLELRMIASKSSTSKYVRFEESSRVDGRIRDTMLYYGAHTGRQAAVRVQPHNLPKKPKHIDKDLVTEGLGHLGFGNFEAIESKFSNPNEFYSSAVKPMIIAEPGKELHIADFSTVEVRVLFWLARAKAGLEALQQGRDLYVEMAADIFKMPAVDLQLLVDQKDPYADDKRQLGKQTVLGAGFGIGVGGQKFQQTCKNYGLEIPLALASEAILAYRKRFPEVPKFWHQLEAAAIKAILEFGSTVQCGRISYQGVRDRSNRRWLRCKLPSGRSIFYFSPEVHMQAHGNIRNQVMVFSTYDSLKRCMVRESTWGGKLTENVVQGTARDITMEAISRCDRNGFDPILAVHDAIITETPITRDDEPFDIIRQRPTWCPDIPIKIEHWTKVRYG